MCEDNKWDEQKKKEKKVPGTYLVVGDEGTPHRKTSLDVYHTAPPLTTAVFKFTCMRAQPKIVFSHHCRHDLKSSPPR